MATNKKNKIRQKSPVKKTAKSGQTKKSLSKKAVLSKTIKPVDKIVKHKAVKKSIKTEGDFAQKKLKVKLLGLGGGGSSIVSEFSGYLKGANFLACDTDIKTAKKIKRRVKFFHFGQSLTQGMGTGSNPEMAEKAAAEEKERIKKIMSGHDILFFFGCLGGGVGSGAGPVFAEICKEASRINNCLNIGIFTMPFEFEGDKKMKIAAKALEDLKTNLSGTMVVRNEKIFDIVDKKISLKKALSFLNQMFAEWLCDLIDIISRPGLINIDFADLKAILQDKDQTLFFNQAICQGPSRAEELSRKVFQNPLLELPSGKISKILYNITGGKDLKLKEIEMVSSAIAQVNPRAKIIFGVYQSPKFNNKIKITLLAVQKENEKSLIFNGQKNHSLGLENEKKSAIAKKSDVKTKKKTPLLKKKEKETKKTNFQPGKIKIEPMRKSGIEVQKAQEEEEKREWEKDDSNWEIPAFMNDIKK